jgi:hypothetical protein
VVYGECQAAPEPGAEPVTGTTDETGEPVKRELARNGKIIKDAGLPVER